MSKRVPGGEAIKFRPRCSRARVQGRLLVDVVVFWGGQGEDG